MAKARFPAILGPNGQLPQNPWYTLEFLTINGFVVERIKEELTDELAAKHKKEITFVVLLRVGCSRSRGGFKVTVLMPSELILWTRSPSLRS